ncbi:hypothetical protein NDU88_004803 [Pleurodeles waltl]|uniref:Uncharacterized protein n=1 Tax=Pleurodeles waltl TaxID=8319 RepID=A0AAV7PLY8_PLEWA|nr:hypothetical protein NDU88_004803 [Pleurodeles waltl]
MIAPTDREAEHAMMIKHLGTWTLYVLEACSLSETIPTDLLKENLTGMLLLKRGHMALFMYSRWIGLDG